MSEFSDDLASLTSRAMASKDPEIAGEVIERLLSAAGFAIALAARGEPRAMGEMLAGAETYLNEAAAEKAPLARVMANLERRRPGSQS